MELPATSAEWTTRRRIIESLDELAANRVFAGNDFEKEWEGRALGSDRGFLAAFKEWLGAGVLEGAPLFVPHERQDMEQIFEDTLEGVLRDIERGAWTLADLRLACGSVALLTSFDWANATRDDAARLTFAALTLERGSGVDHYWCNIDEPHDHVFMKLPWVERLWNPECRALPTERELRRFAAQTLRKEQVSLVTLSCRRIRNGSPGNFDTEIRALRTAIMRTSAMFELATIAIAAWSLELVGREGVGATADRHRPGLGEAAVSP